MVCTAPGGHETRGVRGFCCWSMLLLEAMLLSMVCAATQDHGLFNLQGSNGCLWPRLLPEARLLSLPPESMSMSVVHATAGGQVDILGLCYSWRLCRCLWSMLLLQTIFVCTAWAATEGHEDVFAPGCD